MTAQERFDGFICPPHQTATVRGKEKGLATKDKGRWRADYDQPRTFHWASRSHSTSHRAGRVEGRPNLRESSQDLSTRRCHPARQVSQAGVARRAHGNGCQFRMRHDPDTCERNWVWGMFASSKDWTPASKALTHLQGSRVNTEAAHPKRETLASPSRTQPHQSRSATNSAYTLLWSQSSGSTNEIIAETIASSGVVVWAIFIS